MKIIFKSLNIIKKPPVGIEPTIPGLEVRCVIHCATGARWRLKESNHTSREKHNRAHYQMLSPQVFTM